MQAGDKKLGQVFANDHVNVIPLFQRPYVWDADKNWTPLWHDVTRVALEVEAERRSGLAVPTDSTYFLGAVVVHERVGTNPERLASSHIIDGQQRLTTLQVLLAAMRQVAADRGQDKVAAQCTALLENRTEVLDAEYPEDRYKVWPLPQDRDAFLWAVRRPGDDEREPKAGQRLVEARVWFEKRLVAWLDEEDAEPTRLGDLWLALNSRMQIVQINLGPSDQPQVIFEALNHRGVQLAEADLVKNHLFYSVELQGDGADAERLLLDHWLALDEADWRTLITTGRLKRARVDLLLAYWLTIRTQNDVVVDSLFSDFRAWFGKEGARAADVIRDLRRHADVYERLSALPVDTATGRLVATMRAAQTNTPWPVLLALHANPDVPPSQREAAAEAIDSYLMRRGVAGLTSKDYNHLFLAVLKAALDAAPEVAGDAVRRTLARQKADSRFWPTDAQFAQALASEGLYSRMYRGRLKALLVCLENTLRSDGVVGNSPLDPADDKLNIEHVMPQAWRTNWPIAEGAVEDAEVVREGAIHRLGNLTLATTKLNTTLSNKPWSEKQSILQERSLVCITTASILSSPDKDAFTTPEWTATWDEERIDRRTELLANLALRLWQVLPQRSSPTTTATMATTADLETLGFTRCGVAATRTGIDHPGDAGHGPFCRLAVEDTAPVAPGVYAWTVDGHVTYVGKAKELRQITQGQRMGRAYNDYTYIPPSQASNASDPRARVNGQLNAAIVAGAIVTWWWRELASEGDAFDEEARLIAAWDPPWNRARPTRRRSS